MPSGFTPFLDLFVHFNSEPLQTSRVMTTAPVGPGLRSPGVHHFLFVVSSSPSSLSRCSLHPLGASPTTAAATLALLPGAGANAERSLAPTAGIRGAAALALKARPGSAASDLQARFREPQPPGPQGERRGSPPWLWPRTGRGQGVPPASPAAPTAASRSPERPFGSWLAPPRLWLASQSAWNLSRDRTVGAVQGYRWPRAGRTKAGPYCSLFLAVFSPFRYDLRDSQKSLFPTGSLLAREGPDNPKAEDARGT